MKLKEIIKNEIPTINQNTSGNMALLIMEEYKSSHLIVLSETEFKGILNQESILDMDDLTKPVNSILNQAKTLSLNTNDHICVAYACLAKRTRSALVARI